MGGMTLHVTSTGGARRPAAVPAVELVAPDGRRLVVAPRSSNDRVGELADAIARELGLSATPAVSIDGRPTDRHVSLADAGLVRGSLVRWRSGRVDLSAPNAATPAVVVACVAGPASTDGVALPPGRHVVGRGRHVPVVVDDGAVEPHHGVFDVGDDASVVFTQLAGRTPLRLGVDAIAGRTSVPDGATLHLGASRLRVSAAPPATGANTERATLTPAPGDPWRRSLWRTPRPIVHWTPDPIAIPPTPVEREHGTGIGVASVAVGAIGAVAMALVLRQPMFMLFGVLGVLIAGGTWIGARWGTARERRRAAAHREQDIASFRDDLQHQVDARRRHHILTTPTVSEALVAVQCGDVALWARRAAHPDAFTACLGWGPSRWTPVVADGALPAELAALTGVFETLDDMPVTTDLGPGTAVAVVGGDAALSVVRSIVVQLSVWTGPADWRLLAVVDDPDAWDWCRWLPHADVDGGPLVIDADRPDGIARAIERLADGDERHVLVVTDRSDVLAARTGHLRRFIGAAPSVAVLVHAPTNDRVPAICAAVLEVGSLGAGRWTADASTTAAPDHLHVAGVSVERATEVARLLAGLHDPEDPSAGGSTLTTSVGLGALVARHGVGPIDDPIAVAAAWRSSGDDPPPAGVIGVAGDGVVELDLVRDGPHALIAGTTGSGKSELLRTMVVSLAARSSPDHVTFVLVDYKGGSTFDACADLPHTVGLVTDLDERLAERALVSLGAELRRRERLLRAAAVTDLSEYRRSSAGRPPLPRLVVVVDEFAALAAELPSFLASLVGVAQRGRSLGVHLVLATQRPAGVVSDEIRANTNLRISLRLHDVVEARDVVGDPAPATFPRALPGRAMMRLGPGETMTFQAACSSGVAALGEDEPLRVVTDVERPGGGDVSELTVLVRAIRHAASLCDVGAPHRPWLPPLPTRLDADDLDALAGSVDGAATVGIVDDPGGQRRLPLRWSPADGNLALLGARGTGTTTALLSIVAETCSTTDADALHVYVIDSRGDARFDAVAELAHCGAVVRLHETERMARTLARLRDELDGRRSTSAHAAQSPAIVLAIDGLPALRTALDEQATAAELDALLRLLSEGPALGIVSVVTAEQPGAVSATILAACAERWVLHLDDRAESSAVGLRPALMPVRMPGRLIVASSGLEAQVAVAPFRSPTRSRSCAGPPPIDVLPTDVDERLVGAGSVGPGGELHLPLGLELHTVAPLDLVVPDGEHVLVAGPARSGRSTALARLATAWREAQPDGRALLVRGPPANAMAGLESLAAIEVEAVVDEVSTDGPCLLVVDDAERVEDPSGALIALVSARRPGLVVVAAGRPEALRSLYGHWTTIVRRSRLGLLASACADGDGDVLGELLPRRPPLRPRPGLMWVVSGGDRPLVQVARRFALAT